MPNLTVRLTLGEFEQLIVVAGEVDVSNARHFTRFVDRVLEGTDGDVFIELADVSYIDSTGLSVLLQARDRLLADARQLVLRNPSPQVLSLLGICGLTEHLPIVDDSRPVVRNVTAIRDAPSVRAAQTPDADLRAQDA